MGYIKTLALHPNKKLKKIKKKYNFFKIVYLKTV